MAWRPRPRPTSYPSPAFIMVARLSASFPRHQLRKSTYPTVKMPTYIVTLKDDASPEQVKEAKAKCTEQGGKIIHEYDIIKGFSVSYPEDAITTLESNPHVKAVEPDGVATIQ
ncbi:hypothetical protein MY1884_004737 [Beauveria asiatica]